MEKTRKKKKKHLKVAEIGGHSKVQFGPVWVNITVRIPRKRMAQRLKLKD